METKNTNAQNTAKTSATSATPNKAPAAAAPTVGIADLIKKVTEIAPVASAPVPTKDTARRVIKDEHIAVVLLLMQRTKEKPAFRVNMTKPVRRVARRLVKNGLALNGKNADGFAGFWINPNANRDTLAEYIRLAEERKVKPAREVAGAGRSDKDSE